MNTQDLQKLKDAKNAVACYFVPTEAPSEQLSIIMNALPELIAIAERTSSAGSAVVMSDEHRAVIEEAAQVLESAAAYNRSKGRTVLQYTQQDRADRLRAILSTAAAQPAQEPVAKQPTNGEPEAHKLARILMGMVAGVEDYTPAEIYRDGYSCSDGDVFVHRAADLLAEQAAEIAKLVRHIDNITNIYAAAQAINQADSARLDFVLDKQAVILTIDKDMHQLMVQDWDDDYYVISGEGQAFRTRREAIDAAMEIDAASTTTGDAAIGEKGND